MSVDVVAATVAAPPPETLTKFTSGDPALAAISTVTVMAG
jgi:hypothetical protein